MSTGHGKICDPDGRKQGAEAEAAMEAYWSRLAADEWIDAWGLSRAANVGPITAERFLERKHRDGHRREGRIWYGPA